jgi:hypothetical protein
MQIFRRIQDDERFLDSVIFSNESTFQVNTHNCRIWGSGNPRDFLKHVRDSPKVNVFCAPSRERVYIPFFFIETTIIGIVYLDMLQQFFITLEKCASTSAPVSQVGVLAEQRR